MQWESERESPNRGEFLVWEFGVSGFEYVCVCMRLAERFGRSKVLSIKQMYNLKYHSTKHIRTHIDTMSYKYTHAHDYTLYKCCVKYYPIRIYVMRYDACVHCTTKKWMIFSTHISFILTHTHARTHACKALSPSLSILLSCTSIRSRLNGFRIS